ncbi:copper resistance CopC family protein [Actinoplanes sp. NPDC048796]|uniref:copper resistance CopC family protein n=1 Tax=Actinoplanes sp. NPDC048796 TaxID=3155640 RepID=UPI0033F790EA
MTYLGKVLLGLAALVAVLLPGTPAWAHTQLVATSPAREAVLTKAPEAITLEFSQRLNPSFTTIALSDAARRQIAASTPAVDTAKGTIVPREPLGNGTYTVAYRVVSVDGHTVQGSYVFTVDDPALPPAAATTATPPAGSGGGVPAGVLIGLAALGVALAGTATWFFVAGKHRSAARA